MNDSCVNGLLTVSGHVLYDLVVHLYLEVIGGMRVKSERSRSVKEGLKREML